MAQPATELVDSAPATPAPAIDRSHLARMTFGDRGLECEVLRLFDRQAELLLARMRDREPEAVATLAHTLKGSAASIGATGVMRAAAAVELAAVAADRELAIGRLASAIEMVRAEIAGLLDAPKG